MGEKYSEMPSVLQHIPRIGAAASEVVQMMAQKRIVAIDDEYLESPIEAIFQLWWDSIYPLIDPERKMTLHSQFGFAPINDHNYRADFAIWPTDLDDHAGLFHCVIVELDGHDFHERTKEQVAARNQRDRDFQSKGYRVIHFSGSELHRDPYDAISQVIQTACDEWAKFLKAKP